MSLNYRNIGIGLIALAMLTLMMPSAQAETEEQQERDTPVAPAPQYRIISGRNYEINLQDGKNLLYLIPLNYQVQSEGGLGLIGAENQLQPNEQPELLRLKQVGMAIVGRINGPDLHLSLSVEGILPSPCHRPKIETRETREKEKVILNTLIFSGIPRTKLCPTEGTPISFSLISAKLNENTTEVRINYQPYAEIVWKDNNLTVVQNGQQWHVTRVSDLINQVPINRQWKSQWIDGKPVPKERER
jgi:hypothetical protein